ncbi:MAG: hypothetical protein GY745_19760 [Actinomycetia bacterium]|nr:hypothetical protein [Actinomycetes bacterium]
MNDPLDAIREVAPPDGRDPELLERVRNDFMKTLENTQAAPPKGRRNRRRARMIPIAAVAVLATAAAGVAVLRDSSNTTEVGCPGGSSIDAVSGDPVVDCAGEWRIRHGTEPPAMVAYDNGQGGIVVAVEGDEVPDSFVPLDPGPVQDPALIELEAALDDVGTGLSSGCYDEKAAREIARRELDQLALTAWTITVDDSRVPDGTSTCAYYLTDPLARQVQLIGLEGAAAPNPFKPYADSLADRLSVNCVSLEEAGELARTLAASIEIVVDGEQLDLSEETGGFVVHAVEDPAVGCTRSVVKVGGRMEVVLRGPAN